MRFSNFEYERLAYYTSLLNLSLFTGTLSVQMLIAARNSEFRSGIFQILNIRDMEVPDSPDDFNEIYIVSPLFDNDMEHLLSSGVPLQDSHIQFFMHQLLCAVKYMHRYTFACLCPVSDDFAIGNSIAFY